MSDQLNQLQELTERLHQANLELSEAERPAYQIDKLDLAQRVIAVERWRVAVARWESVTREIEQVLKHA